MIQRAVSVAIAMLLIATFSAPAPVAAAATTRTVCASGCDYTTIQSAINAASAGDTIQVFAGTYAEQVVISKNITVTGAGEEVTIIQSPGTLLPIACLSDLDADAVTIVEICDAAATIRSFTIDGNVATDGALTGMPSVSGDFFGLAVHGTASATMSDVTVTNVHDADSAEWGHQKGDAIWVAPASSLNASNIHVLRYQKSGIVAYGSASDAANLILTDSLVEGDQLPGMNDSIAMNGITIARANATLHGVTSRGNRCDVANCSGSPESYNAGGLLVYDWDPSDPTVTVSVIESIFSENDIGIYNDVTNPSSTIQYTSNDVTGNRWFGINLDEGHAEFSYNDITDNGINGIVVIQGLYGIAPVDATFTRNVITGNGVTGDTTAGAVRLVDATSSEHAQATSLTFVNNAIFANSGVAIANASAAGSIVGTGTWWGEAGRPSDGSTFTGFTADNLLTPGALTIDTSDLIYGFSRGANTITWTQSLSGRAGRADLSLTATALTTVSYLAADATICTIVEGTKVHFVAAGTCTVTAAADADATYLAAAPVERAFTVLARDGNVITWDQSLSGRVGTPDLALTATAATTVSYVSSTLDVCTIVSRKVHFVSAGTCTVTASASANATYQVATPVERTFTVLVAYLPNAITWTQSLSGRVGTADLALTATAQTTVSYLAADATICTIVDGTKVHFVAAGTCTVSAAAGADATYLAAAGRSKSFTVIAAFLSNAITWDQSLSGRVGTPDLALTASAQTTVSYVSNTLGVCTIVSGKVRFLTAGECTVTASASANATYQAAAPSIRSFTVLVAYLPNTITWKQVFGTQRVGTADLTLTATALTAVSYASTNEAICTIVDGTKVHFVAAGTCTVSAAAGADATYSAAAGRSKVFTVLAARP